MTCIVGLVHEGHVYIGADSAGIDGLSLTVRADEKVFSNGEFLMGFCGSFRMGQLLRYSLKPPRRYEAEPVNKYLVVDFVDEVRKCLKDGGYASKKDETESGGCFLLGYQGQLFQVEGDYQVGHTELPFDAIGCGQDIARGALYATQGLDIPKERVLQALQAAERFSAGVRGPFHIITDAEEG